MDQQETMVEIVRHMLKCLEDLVQCRICSERPQGRIVQCDEGHFVCDACRQKIPVCPYCQKQWSKARIRLAESLCQQLDDMKLLLINPEGEMKKPLINNEDTVVTPQVMQPHISHARNGAYGRPIGLYNCYIGSCGSKFAYVPLCQHVKKEHPNECIKQPLQQDDNVFKQSWTFKSSFPMTYNQAFHVAGMGTYFLNLYSPDSRDAINGCVSMIHNCSVTNQFEYRLEIGCCDEHKCGIPMRQIGSSLTGTERRWWEIATLEDLRCMLNHNRKLECTVIIQKKRRNGETESKKGEHNSENYIFPGTRIDTIVRPPGLAIRRLVEPSEPSILVGMLLFAMFCFILIRLSPDFQ